MMHSDARLHKEMCTLATRLAERAGEIARARRGAGKTSLKSDASLVTETDHAMQALILDGIAAAFPDHAVVAEEQVADPARHADRMSARYCWVIDPLDGTRNYVSNMPCFATSIAVLDDGVPVVGVVIEHNTRWKFTAVAGGPTDDRRGRHARVVSGRGGLRAPQLAAHHRGVPCASGRRGLSTECRLRGWPALYPTIAAGCP